MFRIRPYAVALLASVTFLGQNPPPNPRTERSSQSSPTESSAAESIPADSTDLEPRETTEPEYPDAARTKNLQGNVTALILVSESGDVENVHSLTGDPLLTSAAVEAMRNWKFKPYIRSGRPIAAIAKVTFHFGAQGTSADSTADRWAVTSELSNASAMPSAVRVSQGVTQGLIVKKISPEYPEAARNARVQGSVVIAGTISKEGAVNNLQVISGPPELVDAAVNAVRQWVYRPYFLMGRPVEVNTQFTINFTLSQR